MNERALGLAVLLCATAAHAGFDADYDDCKATFKQTRFEDALGCFERIKGDAPDAAKAYLQIYIARSLHQLNRVADAIDAYEKALVLAPGAKAAAKIREKLRLLKENHCGDVVVQCPAGHTVTLRGKTEACPGRFETVPKGEADLLLKQDGAFKGQRTVTIKANREQTFQLAPQDPSRPPKPVERSRWKAVVGWSAIGLGAIAGVVGFYFGIEEDDARTDYQTAVDGMQSSDVINGFVEEVDDWRTRKGLTWAIGGIIGAAGVGLVLWDAFEDDAPVKAWVGPGMMGLTGRF